MLQSRMGNCPAFFTLVPSNYSAYMSVTQYHTHPLSVSKEFLIKTYSHALLNGISGVTEDHPFYLDMWKNTPDPSIELFGGTYGVQFPNKESFESFDKAFDNVLSKFNIGVEHKNHLQYFISFYDKDEERMSLNDNDHNRLIEYVKFILDIHQNSVLHFNRYQKNDSYQLIHDEGPNDYFFAKKTLFEKYSFEDIVECRPNDEPGDTISYMRFYIGITELYVPYDLIFNLTSKEGLRSFDGSVIEAINIPPYLQSELFKFTLNYMVEAHQKANSAFYQAISTKSLSDHDFSLLYYKYKRKKPRANDSIMKLGTLITDYLLEKGVMKTKRSIANFLFNYFALFKLLRFKGQTTFPEDYAEIVSFYVSHKITPETVRLLMKDA